MDGHYLSNIYQLVSSWIKDKWPTDERRKRKLDGKPCLNKKNKSLMWCYGSSNKQKSLDRKYVSATAFCSFQFILKWKYSQYNMSNVDILIVQQQWNTYWLTILYAPLHGTNCTVRTWVISGTTWISYCIWHWNKLIYSKTKLNLLHLHRNVCWLGKDCKHISNHNINWKVDERLMK